MKPVNPHREDVRRMLARGQRVRDIAPKLGLDPALVYRWARSWGIRGAPGRMAYTPTTPLVMRARELYDAGLNVRDVAARINRSRSTVMEWKRRFRWPPRAHDLGPVPPCPDAVRARELYDAGWRMADIAERIGRRMGTICAWRQRYGWPHRPQVRRVALYVVPPSRPGPKPTLWRCPCSPTVLRRATDPCPTCGVPPWAKAG